MDLVTVRLDGTLPLVSLDGELDTAGADVVATTLVDVLVRYGVAVADLAGLRFLDCAGVGMLVGVVLEARRRHLRFVLARPTAQVCRVLQAAAATDLLEIYPGLDEALCAVGLTRGITLTESGKDGSKTRGRGWTSELRPNSSRWRARSSGSPTRSSGPSTS